ncbi:NADH-quinone oxidoreductase subunit C [Pleionea sp. CnH1-48]|uniref:NADH-quinone oxidoreductase subunit C n=1 Tax=Pleionea sp. CnH1-48 TaxID=2954494 RepID=UPI002096A444|nr:NADH-quinone oxidoreductase subunit C [Pleionea sp. CnH1-48]MCO7225056.1 NADH-quinone oxidoreductase subunit C [Pleionea sp. CnH1-48]
MDKWVEQLKQLLTSQIESCVVDRGEVTIEVDAELLIAVSRRLRDEDELHFEQLIDLCGIDYSAYGESEWETSEASGSGFSRAVVSHNKKNEDAAQKKRFAVVYHLLSIANNRRLRMRVFVPYKTLTVPSVNDVWASANWYEREAFDLFGIRFEGHNDLRRLLTDYGFVGHPFRKDFPLIGTVEMRYDAEQGRCVYEPVSIEPRILVPRVIRQQNKDNVPTSEQEG